MRRPKSLVWSCAAGSGTTMALLVLIAQVPFSASSSDPLLWQALRLSASLATIAVGILVGLWLRTRISTSGLVLAILLTTLCAIATTATTLFLFIPLIYLVYGPAVGWRKAWRRLLLTLIGGSAAFGALSPAFAVISFSLDSRYAVPWGAVLRQALPWTCLLLTTIIVLKVDRRERRRGRGAFASEGSWLAGSGFARFVLAIGVTTAAICGGLALLTFSLDLSWQPTTAPNYLAGLSHEEWAGAAGLGLGLVGWGVAFAGMRFLSREPAEVLLAVGVVTGALASLTAAAKLAGDATADILNVRPDGAAVAGEVQSMLARLEVTLAWEFITMLGGVAVSLIALSLALPASSHESEGAAQAFPDLSISLIAFRSLLAVASGAQSHKDVARLVRDVAPRRKVDESLSQLQRAGWIRQDSPDGGGWFLTEEGRAVCLGFR